MFYYLLQILLLQISLYTNYFDFINLKHYINYISDKFYSFIAKMKELYISVWLLFSFLYFVQSKLLNETQPLLFINSTGDDDFVRGKRSIGEEAQMTTIQLIQLNGYPAESFSVETKDNYILDLHRIPYSPRSPKCRNKNKPVVFLAHDIISSSSDFIINGPDQSLAYILSDLGYDVWLGNVRGNTYSRRHRTLLPANMAFWDFTFHEYGTFDIPAMIDFALEESEQDSLIYIGHSMGTTLYFVMMSMHPEYNSKIKAAFLMSPVVYLSWMLSPFLRFFSIFANAIGLVFDIAGMGEFSPKNDLMSQFGQILCKGHDVTQPICTSILFLLSGYNMKNLNTTRFPIYMGHTPAGSSIKAFIHYGQIIQSGSFKQMDWGIADNFVRYNSLKAPRYNLMSATSPVYLIYSNNDWFSNKHDIDRLYRELLPGTAQLIEVKDPQFAHIDFTFGTNAKEEVYDDMVELMKRY